MMKKLFPKLGAFIFMIIFMFFLSTPIFANNNSTGKCDMQGMGGWIPTNIQTEGECDAKGYRWTPPGQDRPVGCSITDISCQLRDSFVPWLATTVMQIVSLLTGLAATILNAVVYYTVVQVSQNYSNITSISETWGVVRDLANIAFIFMLLYASILTIIGLGSDNKKIIVNIIIVAILINFSLFFTKIVIDISNVLALVFYDAIAPGALNATGTFSSTQWGLSSAFMQHLNLTSLYQTSPDGGITTSTIITIGVMGSIMLLIAAFVFFSVAIMFIIRYVILILVIILSPLAFLGFILPEAKKYTTQWLDALLGQAFFAPIYFMLTWVTLRVLAGVMKANTQILGRNDADTSKDALSGIAWVKNAAESQLNSGGGAIPMIINFIVVIVFLIASLIIAKEWANKAPGGVNKLTKWATGVAGGATLGMTGRLGRQTVGKVGQALGENESLKKRAASGSFLASSLLKTGRYVGDSSFDLRSSPIGGQLDAGRGIKGFASYRKAKDEEKEKFAKSLAPSDKEKTKVKNEFNEASKDYTEAINNANRDVDQIVKKPNTTDIDRQISTLKQSKPDTKELDEEIAKLETVASASLVIPEHEKKEAQTKLDVAKKQKASIEETHKKETGEEISVLEEEKQSGEKKYQEERAKAVEDLVSESKSGQRFKAAQAKHDEVFGPSQERKAELINKINTDERKAIENDPNIVKQKELEASIEKLNKSLETASGEIKEQLTNQLKLEQSELIVAKEKSSVRQEQIKKEYEAERDKVKTMKSVADTNKEAYAKFLENNIFAKVFGYNYTAAAKIRKGTDPKDEGIEALKKILKAQGENFEEDEDNKKGSSPKKENTPNENK